MSKSTDKATTPKAGKEPAEVVTAGGGIPEAGSATKQSDIKDVENPSPGEKAGVPDNNSPEIIPPTIVEKVVEKVVEKAVPVFGICENVVIVVCGTTEAIPLLVKAWEQKAASAAIVSHVIPEHLPFSELITALIADESLPDTFILVPANCFPTHRVDIADLVAFRIRKKLDATHECATRLPVLLEATAVLRTLEALPDTYSEEEFFEKYNAIAHAGEMPEEIGMSFGNTVAYADNPCPCMSKLAEALVRKKFICTTAEGFTPIKERLALLYDGK